MKKLLLFALALTIGLLANAGNPLLRNCGTMDNLSRLQSEDPGLQARMLQIENLTNAFVANHSNQNTTNSIITIPVVFHVVYKAAAENISNAQCQAQLDQLNLDYARLNADRTNTPSVWQGISVNTNIQFCLAQRDPNGLATTGIERRLTTSTSFSTNDNVKRTTNGGMSAWPSSSYLNIWSCNLSGGVLGYAQFPGGTASTDGVVILYSSIGSVALPGTEASYDLGRTATHEVGHWLNLYHIWGDESACSGSDNVGDTPNQGPENYGCPTFPHTDACATTSPGVMFMNYMDYTDDACMNMFTAGQSTRMNALFSSGGARYSLLTSLGCLPPSGTSCGIATGLSATATTNSASLSWTAVTGAISYNIQYKLSTATTWASITSSTNSVTLTPLASGSIYNWQVQAVCSTGAGTYSTASTFTTTPIVTCGIPSGLSAAAITTTGASLSWTAVSGATSYNVQYKLSTSTTWTTVTSTTNSISLSALASGSIYSWQVQAICSSGPGAYSTASTFTTLPVVTCGTPSGLSATSITATGVTLSWTAVSGATSYNVQYKLSTSSTWTTVAASGNSILLTTLISASAYQWQVQAICTSGAGTYSTALTFTTPLTGCSDSYESNETYSAAKTIPVNTDISALIGTSVDVDWYVFTTVSPATRIKITLANLAGDYDIRLYSASLTLLATSQFGGTTPESIIQNSTSAATYYIKVYGYNRAFSAKQCYSLRVSTSNTNFRLTDDSSLTVNTAVSAVSNLVVFPNPATDYISGTFASAIDDNINLRVFDMLGRTIQSQQVSVTEGLNKFTLDLNALSDGIYFIELRNSSERIVNKFILEK